MNYNDELDPVLQEALAEYRDAEPLDGLEERVLHRMRLAHLQRRNLWYRWSAALACAALVAIAAWTELQRHPREIVQLEQKVAQQPAPPPTVPLASDAASRFGREGAQSAHGVLSLNVRRAGTVAASRPQTLAADRGNMPGSHPRQQLPTPSPLTSEERALIAVAKTYPQVFESSGANADVTIAPIDVQPLSELHSDSEGNHP